MRVYFEIRIRIPFSVCHKLAYIVFTDSYTSYIYSSQYINPTSVIMRHQVPIEFSIHWRYLHQDGGKTWAEIKASKREYRKFSKATICRHMKKTLGEIVPDRRKLNQGRPRKLSARDERNLLRQIGVCRQQNVNFTIRRLRLLAGTPVGVSDETVRRLLHRHNYGYKHAAKKGVLSRVDTVKRLDFAKMIKRRFQDRQTDLWTKGISFYIDGVSFTHRYNPRDQAQAPKTMVWRKPNERLNLGLTAKSSHEGNGGKVAHFMVAIGYGCGVVLCEQYHGRLNGKLFADFVRDHFKETFEKSANPRGKMFLQDGDPSQNSALARDAMWTMGAKKFSIPARSPDLNPIENLFHLVKKKLDDDALDHGIVSENFDQFCVRVNDTIMQSDKTKIDKTIASMEKRIELVIKNKGQRTKY